MALVGKRQPDMLANRGGVQDRMRQHFEIPVVVVGALCCSSHCRDKSKANRPM